MSIRSYLKPKGGLPDPRRIIVNMSAKASDPCCKHGGGEGCCRQRPWQEVWSVLYIRGSLGCSELFCLFPCHSRSWACRMMLPCARVRNFGVKNFHCPSTSTKFFLTRKFITWKFVTWRHFPIYGICWSTFTEMHWFCWLLSCQTSMWQAVFTFCSLKWWVVMCRTICWRGPESVHSHQKRGTIISSIACLLGLLLRWERPWVWTKAASLM